MLVSTIKHFIKNNIILETFPNERPQYDLIAKQELSCMFSGASRLTILA